MVADAHTPRQTPPNILLIVAAVFIAIILSLAAFIFGSPIVTNSSQQNDSILVEPRATTPANPDDGVLCTMDAKLCPDGTSVGRIPPNCEFAPCPGN